MNSNATVVDPTAPPPPPPQPPRSSFSCDRHPDEQFSGFCPSCLCERLTTLDKSSSNTPSSSRRPSSASAAAAAAIKSLFSSSSSKPIANSNCLPPPAPPKPSKPTSLLPELRRTKSFSATKNEALGHFCEPQRKSCDVRARNSSTLWSLFALDGDSKTTSKKPSAPSSQNRPECSQNSKHYESCVANKPVFEETESEDDFKDAENVEAPVLDDGGVEITPVLDTHLENLRNNSETEVNNAGVIQSEVFHTDTLKLMKDHIDLDTRDKKSSGGGFWAAASVFSKKWHNWRRKQKVKKQNNGEKVAALPVDKPISGQYRETQSEVADYGFGRRSCDTEPRFSLDVGRISFDDPRYSFDEPRASWDGHLIGRTFPRIAPMISVIEDSPITHVTRSDMQIPVEEPVTMTMNSTNENEVVPGGSAQTREYYSDSSSRRRKSLDRSSSMRNSETEVAADIDTKVLPTTADYIHGPKLLVRESLRDPNLNSLRDDVSETFELSNGFRDGLKNGEQKESKKSRSWTWRIWGFIYRLGNGNKFDVEDRYGGINGVERSFSESWDELNRRRNGEVTGGFNRKAFRSNSSVSWRNSNHFIGSFGSLRKPNLEINRSGNKRRDDFVLEKNRSARYSPNRIDNGPLRFYLTPMRSERRGILKPTNSHSITRSMLRLY